MIILTIASLFFFKRMSTISYKCLNPVYLNVIIGLKLDVSPNLVFQNIYTEKQEVEEQKQNYYLCKSNECYVLKLQ